MSHQTRALYVGQVWPQSVRLRVLPSDNLPDLTAVTAAEIKCKRPDGTVATWSVDSPFYTQTEALLILRHRLVAGDLPSAGDYRMWALLTTADGVHETETAVFPVRER